MAGAEKNDQEVNMSKAKEEKITISEKQLEDAFNYNSTMQGISALASVSAVVGIAGVYQYTDSVPLAIIAGAFALFVFLISVFSWMTLNLIGINLDENFRDISTHIDKIETAIAEGSSATDKRE
ncbi:MAG: hypothetical protein ACLFPA_03585 [Dichotomicrobium sp.]